MSRAINEHLRGQKKDADRFDRGKLVAVEDGKPGCPAEVWDGPYKFRCSMGLTTCSVHGRFETRRGFPK